MKKKRIIIIAIILVIIIAVVYRGISLFGSAIEGEKVDFGDITIYEEMKEEMEDEINSINGTGTITSFNIENLDTTLWSKIDKVLVENEKMVSANQEILNTSNDDITGKIYSTISGQFFEQDFGTGKIYSIYDLNNLGFEMEIEEADSTKVVIGQKVDITITATNEKVEGRVCYVSYIPQNEMIKVKVKINNSDKVKIGYSVKAKILLDEEIDKNVEIYDIKNSVPKIRKNCSYI